MKQYEIQLFAMFEEQPNYSRIAERDEPVNFYDVCLYEFDDETGEKAELVEYTFPATDDGYNAAAQKAEALSQQYDCDWEEVGG